MRKASRKVLAILAISIMLPIVVGVVGEFAIEYARENNWYADPSRRVGDAMSALREFVTSPVFLWPAILLVGIAIGSWLDAFLRKREGGDTTPVADINREALADRAEALSRKIASLYGQWTAEHNAEWHKASDDMARAGKPDASLLHTLAEKVDRKFYERFADNYLGEFWSIITTAGKVIALERSDLWWVAHGARTKDDLLKTVQLLEKVAVNLRTPGPDMPVIEWPTKAAPNPSSQSQPQ